MNGDQNTVVPPANRPVQNDSNEADGVIDRTLPAPVDQDVAVESSAAPETVDPATPVAPDSQAAAPTPESQQPADLPAPEEQHFTRQEHDQTSLAEDQDADRGQADQSDQPDRPHADQPLEWAASDAMHQKPSGWYAMLIGGAALLAALVYFISRDVTSAGSIAVAAVLLAMFNARKPRAVHYRLDAGGIAIDRKYYPYNQFRSFSVDNEGVASNIVLMPLKRFMPLLTINYARDIEPQVVALLTDRLPVEAHKHDAMDGLIRKLRF